MSDNLPERVQILGHAHILCIRERPFNLKGGGGGGGGGGYGFFLKKNILIPNVAEKNILNLLEEKKK